MFPSSNNFSGLKRPTRNVFAPALDELFDHREVKWLLRNHELNYI